MGKVLRKVWTWKMNDGKPAPSRVHNAVGKYPRVREKRARNAEKFKETMGSNRLSSCVRHDKDTPK